MLDTLNTQQRDAVTWDSGPLIVLAGPGTGKTRVITARIARLIEQGAEPESILGLTFSTKAAEEMRARLAALVPPAVAERVALSTFHAFGRRIIARFADYLGWTSSPDIADSAQVTRLLRSIIRSHNLFDHLAAQGRENVIPDLAKFIGTCRNAARFPADALEYAEQWREQLSRRAPTEPLTSAAEELAAELERCITFEHAARAFDRFDRACAERGVATFDDLLTRPLELLAAKPIVGALLRAEIAHIVVDEYQDANAAQIELLRHLAPSSRTPDLCVVGDDDQSIYGFRGADTAAFTRFAALWPEHRTIALTTSYRGAPRILAAANAVITRAAARFQPDKGIAADPAWRRDTPASLEAVTVARSRSEPDVIASLIARDRERHPERPWSSYAVLTRSNNNAAAIAATLEVAGIPVDHRGESTPADDAGVKDLLAWIEFTLDDSKAASARRLLVRPPLGADVERVRAWQDEWERASRAASVGFGDFLRAHESNPAVNRLITLLDQFRKLSQTDPADRVIEAIIRAAGLAHTEHLAPIDRAARVKGLAAVLRFARARQPRLDEPGDLREFLAYYHDLSDKEQQFTLHDDETPELADASADGAAAGVRVMTAHKSKGLEFDTVIISRVRPGKGGFPSPSENEDSRIELPADFLGKPSAADDHADEERRLFYVACTRAQRRLVLLAQERKEVTRSTDYFNELTHDAPGLEITRTNDADWPSPGTSGDAAPDAISAAAPPSGRDARRAAILDRAVRRARHEAFAALHDAGTPRTASDSPALAEIEQSLSRCARTIAALAHLRDHAALPPDADLPDWARAAADAWRLGDDDSAALGITRPLAAPLELSYSKITDYQSCPACFYVKHILKLGEAPTTELALGSAAHDALERFYREFRAAESEGSPTPGKSRLLAIAEQLAAAWKPDRLGVVDEQRAQLRQQLANLWDKLHDDALILDLERAFRLPYIYKGVRHSITGKIDRIDQLPSGGFRIIDYKTGKPLKKFIEPEASDLQMGLYALALPAVMSDPDAAVNADAPPKSFALGGVAEYWLLATGDRGGIDFSRMKPAKLCKDINAVIDGLLAGRFERTTNERDCKGLCWILNEHA